MRMTLRLRPQRTWVVAIMGLTLAVSAGARSATLKDMVPEKYRSTPIVIGTTATMPPVESVDQQSGEVIGLEPDLAKAIAAKLGVQVQIKNVAFDGLLAGMQAGRFDIAMSGLADTVQRQQTMDFVDWYVSGVQLIVAKGNPKKASGLDSLCGLTLGGTRASTELRRMEAVAKDCKEKTPLVASENSPAGLLMLKTGRIDAYAVNYPSGEKYVSNNPDAQLIPGQFRVVNRGAAFAKSNSGLRDAWQAGLKAVIDSGEYDKILDRWGSSSASYKGATVNVATQD